MTIADDFCGYLRINGDIFTYSVSKQVVTLLSSKDGVRNRIESIDRIAYSAEELPAFIYGEDNDSQVVFMIKKWFRSRPFGLNSALRFSTPLIIKENGNAVGFYNSLTMPWDKFHAITFVGGNINALCDPQMAIRQQNTDDTTTHDGSNVIELLPWDAYSRTIDLLIGGEKTTLTISVKQSGGRRDSDRRGVFVLGELNTFIRFSFDNAKGFDAIEKYYIIAKSLVSLLTLQDNVSFDTYLSQKNHDNLLFCSAICKIFDGYSNYSLRNQLRVIPIYKIFDCLPALIELIENHEIDALLSLLPSDNGRLNSISISSVQDLCSFFEVAYKWEKRTREKDVQIEELKKAIKNTIADFTGSHPELNINTQTTISSAFMYLDYSLKDKIETLYHENQSVADIVSKKYAFPLPLEERIAAFVKLRNGRTHRGKIEWGESAEIYPVLLAVGYACVLKRIGVPQNTIEYLAHQLF